MSRGAGLRPEVTDDTRLAQARERFLTGEPIEPGQVRCPRFSGQGIQ
jgi:hypothetical protein